MKILILGAGTIGLTYSWLLSTCHDVSVFVRPERLSQHEKGYVFSVQDLRNKKDTKFNYTPRFTTSINGEYDAVLVMVNRVQLKDVLPMLQSSSLKNIVFMLNHWDIDQEVKVYLAPERYFYGFPSQVGGGREGNKIDVVVFDEGTILGEANGKVTTRLTELESSFKQASLSVEIESNILSWLKVHYLQQSLSAGSIAKSGGYDEFAGSYIAIKEMVYAFREGVAVCEMQGVNTKKIFPANMFRYPAFLVAWAMKGMFNKHETIKMVKGHMKQGMPEWIAGFNEVLTDGENLGVNMPVWKSYKKYVDEWIL